MVYPFFEQKAVEDENATREAGRLILRDEDWVNLVIDQNTRTPMRVEEWFSLMKQDVDNRRMGPEELARYQSAYNLWKEGKEAPLHGTDLRHWGQISKAQAENMRNMGLRTVEDLASAHDGALEAIGMGARSLQAKAKAFLEAKDGKAATRIYALEEENQSLKADMEQMKQMMAELKAEKPVEKPKKVHWRHKREPADTNP